MRSLLAILSIHEFPINSIEIVLNFTQYYIDADVFVEIFSGMVVDRNIVEWVIKFNKSLHGLKQASSNIFDLLKTGLERRGYHQSQVDPSVFYRNNWVILTSVDDCVIVSHKQETVVLLIESLNNGSEEYVLEE